MINMLFFSGHGGFGPFSAKRSNELFEFSDPHEGVEHHFSTLKIKLPSVNNALASLETEKGLILDIPKI